MTFVNMETASRRIAATFGTIQKLQPSTGDFTMPQLKQLGPAECAERIAKLEETRRDEVTKAAADARLKKGLAINSKVEALLARCTDPNRAKDVLAVLQQDPRKASE